MDFEKKFAKEYNYALVTGGAGFIGSHIVEKLLKLGLKVTSIDNYSAGKEENIQHLYNMPEFTPIRADVTKIDKIKKYFKGVDIVFHHACSKNTVCMIDPARDLEVNAEGTLNVLICSLNERISKFIHASTGSVYGEPFLVPTNEDHPLQPVSYYGVSKLAGEKYVKLFNTLHGLDITILRYYHVYGPRQDSSEFGGVVSIFCRRAHEGKDLIIFGDGTQVRSFTHVHDVVRINLLAAVKKEMSGNAYNCASGISITIQELAEAVLNHYGNKDLKIKYAPWKPGDIKNFDVDNRRLLSNGFAFSKQFDEGLSEMVNWTNQFVNKK
jgi:UDP-glucose 4-epimerase